MPLEIERKFLVEGDYYKREAYKSEDIAQGYLSSVPERTVRIRRKGDKAYITIKGISNESGLSRYEWEKEISTQEAQDLLKLCEQGVIEKTRYYIKCGEHTFEVDEFRGDNSRLVMAEVELSNENEVFEHPYWLGKEVTGDTRYYNASLVKHPFSLW